MIADAPLPDEARALIGRFVHDLKSPLSSILINGGLLESDGPPGERAEIVRDIRDAAASIDRLLACLSALARSTAEREHDPAPVAVRALVDAAIEAERLTAEAKELRVLRGAPGPEVLVLGDAALLGRAVGALVDNAVTHSPFGGVVLVDVAARRGLVEIRVRDDGPCVPGEWRERALERAANLDPEARPFIRPSRGLGLVAARLGVVAHGGRLVIEEDGAGRNVFVVALPALP